MDRAALLQIGVDVACLDSAHGHNTGVLGALKNKKVFPSHKSSQAMWNSRRSKSARTGRADALKSASDLGLSALPVSLQVQACRKYSLSWKQYRTETHGYSADCGWWYPLCGRSGKSTRSRTSVVMMEVFCGTEESPGTRLFMKAENSNNTAEWDPWAR
jgi:IMP dehydrogenase